jgi:hypothetical protein
MAFHVTLEMKRQVKTDETLQRFRAYAESIRCVVTGDHVSCNHRQKALLQQWWKENADVTEDEWTSRVRPVPPARWR